MAFDVRSIVALMPVTAKPRVCGVTVTYLPDESVEDNLALMVAECGLVVVVDNGSSPAAHRSINSVGGAGLLALGENLGIAAALNRGFAQAEALGFQWVVTFDQDSRPASGMVDALLRTMADATVSDKIAVVGANTIDASFPERLEQWPMAGGNCFVLRRTPCSEKDLSGVATVITSGSLVRVSCWRELGGFDEALFIDYVDHEFCLRARSAGYDVRVSARARLIHSLGSKRVVQVLGRELTPNFHSPLRHYYMARNRIVVWKRYAWRFPYWFIFDASDVARNLVRVFFGETEKLKKFSAIIRGTCMGLVVCFRSRRRWVGDPPEQAQGVSGTRA